MRQMWKGIYQSMFQLTKKLYSAAMQKVLVHFAVHAECIAEGFQHTGSFHKKLGKYALHVIAPALGVAALTVSFGFAMQSINGVSASAQERQVVYGEPFEVMNQLLAENASDSLMIQPKQITSAAVSSDTTKITTVCTKVLAEKSTGTYKEAVGLYVNGNFIGAVENVVDLEYMLQDLLNNNAPETYQSISFADDIQTKTDIYPVASIESADAIKAQLTGLSNKPMGYTVTQDDTWNSLAEKFGVTANELKALNPSVSSPLQAGDKLSVIVKKSILNISVVKEETYEKDVEFETEVQKDDTKYNTYSEVITEGENGKATYVDAVTYINGKEAERSNVSTTVTQEPVTKVVIEGTKTPPDGSVPGESSGTLTWPLPTVHTVSSTFSFRWGSHHNGIDIANGNAYGETIVAADAGTVEFAQMDGSGYGLYVIINHGNGRKTLYGHTSELLVKAGEKVYKGQPIALVGNTGNSFGAHLHFEVIENGTPVDPLNYVSP